MRKRNILVLVLAFMLAAGAHAAKNQDGPQLKVVSPTQGYLLGTLEERRVSIVVEITCPEAGLSMTDRGAIRFVEPNRNTSLFAEYTVSTTQYTNKLGRTVFQVVSVIPATSLELADFSVNPPIAFEEIRPKQGEKTFSFRPDEMVAAAAFNFQVEDVSGRRSPAEQGEFIIGLAKELWRPKTAPKSAP